MRLRTVGPLLLLACVAVSAGCAKPWYGFEWMFPVAQQPPAGSDEEYMAKVRKGDSGIWATGVSDRSREIEARLGVE